MKNLIFITVILLFNSCKYFKGDNCNNTKTLSGMYYNGNEKNAKHSLKMFENGTFERIYQKDDIVKKNKGTWKLSENSCNLYFDSLIFL